MFRHQVSKLSHNFPLAFGLKNPKLRTLLPQFSPIGNTSRGISPRPQLRRYGNKHSDIPSPSSSSKLRPISSDPGTVKPLKTPSVSADPWVLVPLGYLTIGESVNHSYHRGAFDPLRDYRNSLFERHTASLLDGLAVICVKNTKQQVLAVAVQVDYYSRNIRLTIAGNDNVTMNVVQHLEATWKILRSISNQHAKNPPIDEELLRTLQRTIYKFASNTLQQKFDLHRLEFRKFVIACGKITSRPGQTASKVHRKAGETLSGVANVIEHTLAELLLKLQGNGNLEETEWGTMCIMMHGILGDCEHLLNSSNEGFCGELEVMARKVDETISREFSLRYYLENITFLESHIRALFRASTSRFLRSIFAKKLSIHIVPAERNKPPNLSQITQDKWEELGTSIAHQQGYTIPDTSFLRKLGNCPSTKWKVHCECLLVKHFHILKRAPKSESSPWTNVPPFSYIGVSKLSCQNCGSWLKAYNSLNQQVFATKGISRRWSVSWGTPQLGNNEEMKQIQAMMAEDLARKYCLHQSVKGRMVLLPDDAGTLPIKDRSYHLDNEKAALYAIAKLQKAGKREVDTKT